MNRYKFNLLDRDRPKAFYLKPGYTWMINSLGILENSKRPGQPHFPASLEIVSIRNDRVSFIDKSGGGELQVGKLLYMYDSLERG